MTAPKFDIEPWGLSTGGLDAAQLAHEESVFGLSNGHVGWRGNLDEGDPRGLAGSYLNGVFEEHPMPYAEDGYGYPDTGQSVINVPNGQLIRLHVSGEPFTVRHGSVEGHVRRLDFRDGTLQRSLTWTAPSGDAVEIRSTRLVSFEHRSIAAVRYSVRAVASPVEVVVESEVRANEPLPTEHGDPRVQDLLARPLVGLAGEAAGASAVVVHRTRESGLTVATAMDHVIVGEAAPDAPCVSVSTRAEGDIARTTIRAALRAGEALEFVKFVGHEWSERASVAALQQQAATGVAAAVRDGWGRIAAAQRRHLDAFWSSADVHVEGEPRLQQAVRFALFQLHQASARLERRSIPGKGLTGSGYEGHTFWDFEAFVLPVLISTSPRAAEQALRWRYATLDHARDRAKLLRLEGAAFAWRTIDGRESSGYWPASTAAFHVNADIAMAVVQYVRATGDTDFERECGVEMLMETARLWLSLGRRDERGAFHIDGVTGPDEYSAVMNDNVYTNLMVQLNLRGAAASARAHADGAGRLGIAAEEISAWEAAADAMHIPFDSARGVHPQAAGYTDLARWDFESTHPEQYLLHDHFPYFDLYRKQVVKQADLVLALFFAHESFTFEEKDRAFAYYEAITVRDSSLSAAAQAVVAAEVGHLDLAYDYLAEVATLDLDDLHGNTEEGLHVAALGGVWLALVCGFGGLRDSSSGFGFAPRLPSRLSRLTFAVRVQGSVVELEIAPTETTYRLREGGAVRFRHFGEEVVLGPDRALRLPTEAQPAVGERPVQPRSRAPRPAERALAEQ
ncbi:glycoside hydrolase family 65 protein [Leucobacter chromiiresistens]|uniref:Glycosyl hydrolase n=1 Tax=Leucobacter chromiiresistens TaxID=1079994 RepID=A0A147EMK5_9MICO|nr:glycosyl hydrolase family 65 protein [Leucobacter chromiiresistens]KTR85542.1 glycosyl hydrolase [Leucobacter chromiiresistens]